MSICSYDNLAKTLLKKYKINSLTPSSITKLPPSVIEEKKSINTLLKYGKDITALAENNTFGVIS